MTVAQTFLSVPDSQAGMPVPLLRRHGFQRQRIQPSKIEDSCLDPKFYLESLRGSEGEPQVSTKLSV